METSQLGILHEVEIGVKFSNVMLSLWFHFDVETHLSPSSCICNHPINPLNHTAIRISNPCLGEKCWWNIPNISQSLTCTTQLMITPGRYALPDGKNKIIVHPSTAIYFIAYTPLGGLGGQNTWTRLLSCTQLLATAKLLLQPCCYAPARWSWAVHVPLAWPRPNSSMPRLTPPHIYALNVNRVKRHVMVNWQNNHCMTYPFMTNIMHIPCSQTERLCLTSTPLYQWWCMGQQEFHWVPQIQWKRLHSRAHSFHSPSLL